MIYVTALTFLLIGYLLGRMQHQPDLPQTVYRQMRQSLGNNTYGPIARPSARDLELKANPQLAAEHAEMAKALKELGVPKP